MNNDTNERHDDDTTPDVDDERPRYLSEYRMRMEKIATIDGFDEQWSTVADAVPLCQHVIQDADREHLIAIAIGPDGRPMGLHIVSIGTLTASMAHPRETFRFALEIPCHCVLIAHNHPTIDVTPSGADIEATIRMRDVGELLGVPLFGSLIIGRDGYWTDIVDHLKKTGKDRQPYWNDDEGFGDRDDDDGEPGPDADKDTDGDDPDTGDDDAGDGAPDAGDDGEPNDTDDGNGAPDDDGTGNDGPDVDGPGPDDGRPEPTDDDDGPGHVTQDVDDVNRDDAGDVLRNWLAG